MGYDNRSFIYEFKSMSSVYEHYRYLGGSLKFTVDLSKALSCGCESGVFLNSPDGDCYLNGF